MRQHNLKVTGSLQINGESVVSASQIVGLESASIHNGNWTASVENNEFKVVNGGSNLLYITSGSTEINNGTLTITADSFASDYAEDYTELGDALLLKGNGVVSGSFRPATGGIHDLGSITHPWKELFVSTGSINLVENGNVAFTITADTIVTTDTLTSGTIDLTKSLPTGVVSGSSQITFSGISSLPTLVSSSSQITYANISSIPVGIVSGSAQVIEIISPLNSYTSSVKNAISVIGEGTSSITTIYGNLVVEGTTLTVSASNLAIADNMIYLNDGNEITDPDLGIAGNYNDGTYSHAGIFSDASDSHTWKVYKGYTPEPSQSIDITHGSFTLADFQAATLKGSIAATNGVVSGSSQVIGILSSLNTYTGSNDTKWSTLLNVTSSLIARTGSLATTGSNTFFANQIVSGNVVITGSLGIGAPANEKFGVTGATGSQGFFRWTDGVTTSAFLGLSGTTAFIHANNNTLGLGANGSNNFAPTMTLNSGKVGIGTTNPSKPLHVYSTNTSATSQLKLTNSGVTPSGYLGMFADTLYINAGGTFDGGWTLDGSVGVAAVELYSFDGGSQINFSTAASNTTPANRMTILNNGNIGIGVTNPSYKLHIGGTAYASTLQAGATVNVGTSVRGAGVVHGNISSNITAAGAYVLLARLDEDAGWICRGTVICASWTCHNVADVYIRKAYASTSVEAIVTGVSKSGQDMAIVDVTYSGARYLAFRFTGGNGEIDVNLTGFGLASYLNVVTSVTSVNSVIAGY